MTALEGNDGADTYIFGRDYGKDRVNDFGFTFNDQEINTIELLSGITTSDVRLTRMNTELHLSIIGSEDSLSIISVFLYTHPNPSVDYKAFQIQFADGTTWDKAAHSKQ
jgi:hypothetical protein